MCWENTFSFFRQKSINTAVVTEKTTEAFDWKQLVSYREVEFTETSLIAYPWYEPGATGARNKNFMKVFVPPTRGHWGQK